MDWLRAFRRASGGGRPAPARAAPKPTPRPRGGLWSRFSGVFGSKFPTLQFFGPDGSWEVVQLKRLTGSLVLVRVRGQVFPVYLDSTKAKTYRYAGVPAATTYLFSLSDMFPFDPSEWSRIDADRIAAGYPTITPELAALIVASRDYLEESGDNYVTVSDLAETMYAKEVAEAEIQRQVSVAGVTKIAKPAPDILDFCTKRLLVDPGIITAAVTGFEGMDREWRLIASPARGPFRHWALVGMLMLGMAAAGVVIVGFTEGWFGDLAGGSNLEAIFEAAQQYATPEAARVAEDASDAVIDALGGTVGVSSATGAVP